LIFIPEFLAIHLIDFNYLLSVEYFNYYYYYFIQNTIATNSIINFEIIKVITNYLRSIFENYYCTDYFISNLIKIITHIVNIIHVSA
jgi:hypothetical protein